MYYIIVDVVIKHTSSVLKIVLVIDSVRLLGHWFNGQIIGSLIETRD